MKQFCLAFGLSLLPALAGAQVVVNHAALDQLAGVFAPPPVVAAPAAPVVRHVVVRRRVVRHIAPPLVVTVAKPAPAPAVLPVVAKPPPPPAAPKPPPGMKIHFASGSADLPAGTTAALNPFCSAPGLVTITATAPADPSDHSAAMRLSMLRAFAVRGALTACGLSTASILPRALGAVPGQDPDVTAVSAAVSAAP